MRGIRASKRGRWLSLLVAGVIGYLLGDWHALATRSTDLSASQNVALRFPEAQDNVAATDSAAAEPPTGSPSAMVLGDPQLALLNPQRMVPTRQAAAPQQAPVQTAVANMVAPLPPADTVPTHRVAAAVAAVKADVKSAVTQARAELKSAAQAVAHANRAGFVLNDAQIASIRARLHLTPDQERMWPGVEAALRNIAYAKARDGRRYGGAGAGDLASLDPDSAEVQGLKSAAVPLIMSFNDEQKSEVRSLAHVMGLDQLASQF